MFSSFHFLCIVIALFVNSYCTLVQYIMSNANSVDDNCDYIQHCEINEITCNTRDLTIFQLNIRGPTRQARTLKTTPVGVYQTP